MHVTLFSLSIGPLVILDFDSPSNPYSYNPPTIVIQETNTKESIRVSQVEFPDPGNSSDSISAIEVDYPNSSEIYPTGLVNTATQAPVEYDDSSYPQYTQIVTEADGPITTPQTIVIESGVTSWNAQGQKSPVNAVLLGGQDDNDLEYNASGQAILVGGGSNNTLVGGNSGSVIEFGNSYDPSAYHLITGNTLPGWLANVPPEVQEELSDSEQTDLLGNLSAIDTLSASGTGDYIESEDGNNDITEAGADFTVYASGTIVNNVQVTAPTSMGTTTSTPGPSQVVFPNADASNLLSVIPNPGDNVGLSTSTASLYGNYLQIEGGETNIDVYKYVDYVTLALQGGTTTIGDLSSIRSLESLVFNVGDPNGPPPPSGSTTTAPNTIIFDMPASGAPTINLSDTFVEYPGLGLNDLTVQDQVNQVTDVDAVLQGLTAADTVIFPLDGGSVNITPEEIRLRRLRSRSDERSRSRED